MSPRRLDARPLSHVVTAGDQVRLHVEDSATEGPAVLFVPGYGMTGEVFARQAGDLAGRWRVLRMDPRGHGQSDRPLVGYDLDRLADDVLAVADQLVGAPVTVVGWSLGGLAATRAALRGPELVRHVVLVCSNGVSASRQSDFPFGAPAAQVEEGMVRAERADPRTARRAGIASAFAHPPTAEILDQLTDLSMTMPSEVALQCLKTLLHSSSAAQIGNLTIPVSQIYGDRDPVFSSRSVAWLSERLPDFEAHCLSDCGHYPMLETPASFAAALHDTLERHRPNVERSSHVGV